MNNQLLITVVTVVYNDQYNIGKTIESVLMQDGCEFEYLVIDGNSSDETYKMALKYEQKFQIKNCAYRVLSEPDSGIYNAMNKAACLSNGRYVLFLNSGDLLFNKDVLKKTILKMNNILADIYYGDVICKDTGLYRLFKAKELSEIVNEMPFCHQSVFTSRELLMTIKYNEKYKICADHAFYLQCFLQKKSFYYLDYPISIYQMGGFSSQNDLKDYYKEKQTVLLDERVLSKDEYGINLRRIEENSTKQRLRKKIKKCLPFWAINKYRQMVLKKSGWKDLNSIYHNV